MNFVTLLQELTMGTRVVRVDEDEAYLHSVLGKWPASHALPKRTAGRLVALVQDALQHPNGKSMLLLKNLTPAELPMNVELGRRRR